MFYLVLTINDQETNHIIKCYNFITSNVKELFHFYKSITLLNAELMKILQTSFPVLILLIIFQAFMISLKAQGLKENPALDEKVNKFLSENKGKWHDLNVPESDGRLLYDIIVKNNYKNALEIGTSTGHSGIWIAWALSKTGGKLTTIEIDKNRHQTAIENFRKAGLSDYIDARLADAHTLVKELKGPFDFVFSDADKDWYKNYFVDIDPKLIAGGCFTAHNVSEPVKGNQGYKNGQAIFLEYVLGLKNYETTVNSTGAGVSISYKKAEK
jgi:caffeoyl-CoA O-methyltransferase